MLTVLRDLPHELLDCETSELDGILRGPTLIHLVGRRTEPLFVSVLLHGNEDTGLKAMQAVLRKYRNQVLPRALSVFIGNVAAARVGVRRLDAQPDYNRVWPGADEQGLPEHALMREVVAAMRVRGVFASIDIHNNTGLNPHYACVNRLDQRFLHLARLFSRIVVYFRRPRGVQSMAFAEFCPAVTVECAKPGNVQSHAHAADFLEACLRLTDFPQHPVPRHDRDLFETVARIRVPLERSFRFGRGNSDICFRPDLDHMNFRELAAGTVWGELNSDLPRPLEILDNDSRDVFDEYFSVDVGQLTLLRPVMPAMLTLDGRAIREDCLCYLMQKLDY